MGRRLDVPVAEAWKDTLGHLAYARGKAGDPLAMELLLITHPVDEKRQACIEAHFGPEQCQTELPLVCDPDDLLRVVGLQAVWGHTDKAIAWAVDDLIGQRKLAKGVRL